MTINLSYEQERAFEMARDMLCSSVSPEWVDAVESGPGSGQFTFRMAYEVGVRVVPIVWTVWIDHDADGTPGEGWRDLSKCVRVEVTR